MPAAHAIVPGPVGVLAAGPVGLDHVPIGVGNLEGGFRRRPDAQQAILGIGIVPGRIIERDDAAATPGVIWTIAISAIV